MLGAGEGRCPGSGGARGQWALTASILVALLTLLASCSGAREEVVVFAAASLTEPFGALAAAYEGTHPGTEVRLNLGASSLLSAQIAAGAPADVFASADASQMRAAGLGSGRIFALTRLAIVTVPGSGIRTPADLGRPGLRVVLAAAEVPAGNYARSYLASLSLLAEVEANLVSNEPDVTGVLSKVRLGEADAGIVYLTDTIAGGGEVRAVALPRVPETLVRYPIAALGGSLAGSRFVAFVLSPSGRAVLQDHGFELP